jgi:hypothetical protein
MDVKMIKFALIMKFLRIILLLALAAFMATSCDFFRRVAGRPTSSEIEAKAEAIEARRIEKEKERQKAIQDSIAAVRKHEADSVAAMDTLKMKGYKMMATASFGGLAVADLPSRYYIIVGSFTNMDNALRCSQKYSERGYDAEVIALKNGYNVVGVCKTDDLVQLYQSLKELKRQAFCPPQVWILTE